MPDNFLATIDLFHRGVLFGGLLLFFILEAARPRLVFINEWTRIRHGMNNIALWLLGFLLVDLWITPWLRGFVPGTDAVLWSWLSIPLVFQALLGILILDLASWMLHWLEHRIRWLWLLHAVHHSDPTLDVTTALRFHPGSVLVSVTWQYALMAILGLPVWATLLRMAVLVPVTLWQHANLKNVPSLDRKLRVLISTQMMHRLHHSTSDAYSNSNYGIVFSFWDRLFGTYRSPENAPSTDVGLEALRAPEWHRLKGLLLTPFLARQQKNF